MSSDWNWEFDTSSSAPPAATQPPAKNAAHHSNVGQYNSSSSNFSYNNSYEMPPNYNNLPSAPMDPNVSGGGYSYGNNPAMNFSTNNYNYNDPSGGGGGGYGMFPQQIMSDPLFNTARQIGGQFAEQQKEKISKYLSSFQLKYYFAVDSAYVAKKLAIILFPFLHNDWTTKIGTDGDPLPPRQDTNAPDLYIPLMGFLTYVLVAGFVLGIQKRFSPEKLGMLTTNALFYLCLENLIVFITKYALNISQSLNLWHALSYSTYKFVGMIFCLLLYLVGGTTAFYCALAYCIFSTVFFLLRSLKTIILDMGYSSDGGRKRKLYLLLSITVLQTLIMWLLTRSVISYMPDNYDVAKMAMSGMGLAAAAAKKDSLPLMPNGDIDYEAALNMP